MNTSGRVAAVGTASMPKALCIIGMAVSVLLLVVFGLDLAANIPFAGHYDGQIDVVEVMDVGFLICAGLLGYLSWTTFRQQI